MLLFKRQILFYLKILCVGFWGKSVILGSPLIDQSINSGGGWANGSQNSSFNVYGEIYHHTLPNLDNLIPTQFLFNLPLTIAENQPIGTIVGEFNATDPDANRSCLILWLMELGMEIILILFESNGIPRPQQVLNFEADNSLSIRVQAKMSIMRQ